MKHENAYCRNGRIYQPEDIKSRNSLVEMRYHGLLDVTRQFELVAVNSEPPFFRYKNSPGENLTRTETNPNHEEVKKQILEILQKSKSLYVYTTEFIDGQKNESSMVNLDEKAYSTYIWKAETFKKISSSEYTYFDICGFSNDSPFSTSIKPTIFIEVILTSFLQG